LFVKEFSGPMVLPSERLAYVFQPKHLTEHRFKVDVAASRALCSTAQGAKEQIPADELPERVVMIVLNLVSQFNRGLVTKAEFG
jgi:hypothetical protein